MRTQLIKLLGLHRPAQVRFQLRTYQADGFVVRIAHCAGKHQKGPEAVPGAADPVQVQSVLVCQVTSNTAPLTTSKTDPLH